MLADLRFALRQLRKSPGFTLTAVLTLALGIGANTAVFSLVNAILLRQLPFKNASRVAALNDGLCSIGICLAAEQKNPAGEFHAREHALRSFQYVAEYTAQAANFSAAGAAAMRIPVTEVSSHFLDALGVQPVVGRNFHAEEDLPGQDAVAVISYRLWQSAFQGRADVLGRSIDLNARRFTVIGVAPREVDFPNQSDAWVPTVFDGAMAMREEGAFYTPAIMRLADGVSMQQAQAELTTLYNANTQPRANRGDPPRLESLAADLTAHLRPTLFMLSGAIALVMLIVCANMAGLMVARASERRTELAVRAALGASRTALMRQQWVESLAIALCGGIGGIACANGLIHVLYSLRSQALSGFPMPSLSTPVLAYTLLLSVLTGLVFGMAPAWLAGRQDPGEALKSGQWRLSAESSRLQRALVVGEIALALVLLAGAGLLIRTMQKMGEIQLGFQTDHLLTFSVTLHGAPYEEKDHSTAAILDFQKRVLEGLRGLPGVMNAAGIDGVPLRNAPEMLLPAKSGDGRETVALPRHSTPGYFATMQIPLLEGRDFAESDDESSPKVAVVTRDLADKLWPGREVIGQQLQCLWHCGKGATVIGVVASQRSFGARETAYPIYYLSSRQGDVEAMTFVLRTKMNPDVLEQSARTAVAKVDAKQPVFHVATMDELLDDTESLVRLEKLALSIFAVLAVLLAAIGIYGTIAYTVSRRVGEIGLRMALGAQRENIAQAVLLDSLRLTVLGSAIGMVGALGLGHLLQASVFGISTHDPLTLAIALVVFLSISTLAAWIPARRAASVEPMEALRNE
jgi:putative ABC transport system permease protein